MKDLRLFCMLTATIVAAVISYAAPVPTLFGPSGTAALPTADIAPAGAFVVAADFYNTDPDNTIPVRALYGIGSNFEVGGLFAFNDTSNVWGANAKFAFAPFGGMPDTGIGALFNRATDIDSDAWQVYVNHTHDFTMHEEMAGEMPRTIIRATAGANWTRVKVDDVHDSGIRFFASADVTFREKFTVAAEFQTKKSALETDSISSAVVRYQFTPMWIGQVGFTNVSPLGVTGTGDHNVFAGLTYIFGGTRTGMK